MEEWEIKGMIHAYRTSINVLNQFDTIEDRLKELKGSNAPENAADSVVQQYLDPMINLSRKGKLPKE